MLFLYCPEATAPRFAPPANSSYSFTAEISISFLQESNFGSKISKYGRLFCKSLVYNSYFDVRFIKIFEIHYK